MMYGIKLLKRTIFILFIIGLILVGGYWFAKDNIHTVIPGQVYRSAQLSTHQFKKLIKKDDIKSILNLRGVNDDTRWYQEEIRLSKDLGVQHYDLGLLATQLPSLGQLRFLVQLMIIAPRPMLIHCAGGADRTGLASALAILLADAPLAQAQKQISFYYFAISKKSVGRLVLPLYQNWLVKNHMQSSRNNFLIWLFKTSPLPA